MYHVSCHHVLQVGNIRFLQPSLMFLRLNCARKSRCFLVTLWFVSTAIVQSWGGGSPPHEHCQHSFSHSAVKTILGINIVWGNPETVTCAPTRDSNEGYPKARNHGEGPRAFSWLKAATTAFTFKTLLRHYAKRTLTPRSLNVKLGPRRKGHKGRAAWLA